MKTDTALSYPKIYAKSQALTALFLCAIFLIPTFAVSAFETDQYNLPPQPLADIGGEVSEYAEENIAGAIDKLNAKIAERQSCLEKTIVNRKKTKCDSPEKTLAKLAYLRSETAVTREVYKRLGDGIVPFTKSGGWMESHDFKAQPARYKTGFGESIFRIFPVNYLTISKTVNLYGSQLGTDKIAHFFQQGYGYYKRYNDATAAGSTPAEAAQKAVRWGRMTERTFYGTLASGVYSNADLFANYVGMKFYQNLTREVVIGDSIKPAILRLENGFWKFNEQAVLHENLLKPFISDYLNEALNPSVFIVGLRSFVRRTVKKQSCQQWLARYPNLSQAELTGKTEALKLWHGEDYGFKDSKHFVTIANTCFNNKH